MYAWYSKRSCLPFEEKCRVPSSRNKTEKNVYVGGQMIKLWKTFTRDNKNRVQNSLKFHPLLKQKVKQTRTYTKKFLKGFSFKPNLRIREIQVKFPRKHVPDFSFDPLCAILFITSFVCRYTVPFNGFIILPIKIQLLYDPLRNKPMIPGSVGLTIDSQTI